MIPYSRQTIENDDIAEMNMAAVSDWLTQGPYVEKFEYALAKYCGTRYAVVVNSGTAALHAAYAAIDLGKGDEFITSPITFPATTNAGLWQGATPVFADIDPSTGNIDPRDVEAKITSRTKAIVPIDYTGRPADLSELRDIANAHGLSLIEDACQALGADYQGGKIGSISDLTVFSFHPVKTITTGEGGAILTNNEEYYKKMKRFITHGITKHDFLTPSPGEWYFEMQELGQNYRLTDIQSALGYSQVKKIERFVAKRQELACHYTTAFASNNTFELPPADTHKIRSAWHLYVVRLRPALVQYRTELFAALRKNNIGVQVHHIPVYYHPYYQCLGYRMGLCPRAEEWYKSILSLPLFPTLSLNEQNYVIEKVLELTSSLGN